MKYDTTNNAAYTHCTKIPSPETNTSNIWTATGRDLKYVLENWTFIKKLESCKLMNNNLRAVISIYVPHLYL